MNKSATLADLRGWKPCLPGYLPERIEEIRREAKLAKKATAKTLYQRLRGVIPDADLIWLLCHEPLLSKRHLRLFAADCAAHALLLESRAGRKPHRTSYAAVRAARQHADGKISDEELAAAGEAAWAAAGEAAWAAWAAAREAAGAGAAEAAWAAESRWQLRRLVRYIHA